MVFVWQMLKNDLHWKRYQSLRGQIIIIKQTIQTSLNTVITPWQLCYCCCEEFCIDKHHIYFHRKCKHGVGNEMFPAGVMHYYLTVSDVPGKQDYLLYVSSVYLMLPANHIVRSLWGITSNTRARTHLSFIIRSYHCTLTSQFTSLKCKSSTGLNTALNTTFRWRAGLLNAFPSQSIQSIQNLCLWEMLSNKASSPHSASITVKIMWKEILKYIDLI